MLESELRVGMIYRQKPSPRGLRYKNDDVIITGIDLIQRRVLGNFRKAPARGDNNNVWWWLENFCTHYCPVVSANQIWKELNES
jgi:hypothetical protein